MDSSNLFLLLVGAAVIIFSLSAHRCDHKLPVTGGEGSNFVSSVGMANTPGKLVESSASVYDEVVSSSTLVGKSDGKKEVVEVENKYSAVNLIKNQLYELKHLLKKSTDVETIKIYTNMIKITEERLEDAQLAEDQEKQKFPPSFLLPDNELMQTPKKESKSKKKRSKLIRRGLNIAESNPHAIGTIYNNRTSDYDPTNPADLCGIDKPTNRRLSKLKDKSGKSITTTEVLERNVSVPDKEIELDIDELSDKMVNVLRFGDSMSHFNPVSYPPPMVLPAKNVKK